MAGEMENITRQLEELMKRNGFVRPEREPASYPEGTVWRDGSVPDYAKADLAFFKGRTKNHKEGSLPFIVENLVKKWEMEMTHLGEKDWTTVSTSSYR